jgi:hypothetical protein
MLWWIASGRAGSRLLTDRDDRVADGDDCAGRIMQGDNSAGIGAGQLDDGFGGLDLDDDLI